MTLFTTVATVVLFGLSGWFLTVSALAGMTADAGIFNYLLPATAIRMCTLIRIAGRYFDRLVNHDITFRLLASVRVRIFKDLQKLSSLELNAFAQGDLFNRFMADVQTLDQMVIKFFIPLVNGCLIVLLITLVLAQRSLLLGGSLGAILLGISCLLFPRVYRDSRSLGSAVIEARSAYRSTLQRWLSSQVELLLFDTTQSISTTLREQSFQFSQIQSRRTNVQDYHQNIFLYLGGIMNSLLLLLGIYVLHENQLDPGFFVVSVFMSLLCIEILTPSLQAIHSLGEITTALNRINTIVSYGSKLEFPAHNKKKPAMGKGYPMLQLEQVDFYYPHQLKPTLSKLQLTLQQGEILLLKGQNGSGKSTLLQLLTRSFEPTQGKILLYGQSIRAFSENQLRQHIGLLPQRIDLFNTSLRANLHIARSTATDRELTALLEQLGLDDLLRGRGLDGCIGQGGRTVSGGERRRIGVARLLLQNSDTFLIDEPLEALDHETAAKVLQSILPKASEKTMVVVTHVPSEALAWNRMIELREGCLIQSS